MRIGIIGAMDEEMALLKEQLEGTEESTIAGYHFYEGTLSGKDVVLLQSGIGKVNAAMATTLLLQEFSPDCIINTGSAGGFDHSLKVGDVVISSEVRHHDVDVTAFNYEYGQVPGLPAAFLPDDHLVDVAEKAAKDTQEGIQIVKGLIATGDSFMSDPERVEGLRSHFSNLQAVEMEAAAIAQVCHQFKKPFVIIRALSDIAGKESHVSFDQFLETAAKHSAQHILTMVKELV